MDSILVTFLSHFGPDAGVFLVLVLTGIVVPGWVHKDLKERLKLKEEECAAERDRADTAVAAAQGSRDVMAAMRMGLQMARGGDDAAREITPGGPAT